MWYTYKASIYHAYHVLILQDSVCIHLLMMFNVPQYIDVEDKVAGPLTAKQLMWMIGMGAVLLLLYSIFDQATFFILAIPIVLLFVALAFYRPYGQPLISFIGSSVLFFIRPKVYVWNRPSDVLRRKQGIKKEEKKEEKVVKAITAEEIRRLSQIVDRDR